MAVRHLTNAIWNVVPFGFLIPPSRAGYRCSPTTRTSWFTLSAALLALARAGISPAAAGIDYRQGAILFTGSPPALGPDHRTALAADCLLDVRPPARTNLFDFHPGLHAPFFLFAACCSGKKPRGPAVAGIFLLCSPPSPRRKSAGRWPAGSRLAWLLGPGPRHRAFSAGWA